LFAVSRTHEREISAIGCENALDLQAFGNRTRPHCLSAGEFVFAGVYPEKS